MVNGWKLESTLAGNEMGVSSQDEIEHIVVQTVVYN